MNIVEQLKRDEGVRWKPYRDQVGKLTIGVGRNLDDVGISPREADLLLVNDISRAEHGIDEHLPWALQLDDVRRGALINMAFNVGIAGLLGFREFLRLLEARQWAEAAKEMLQSKWAEQVGGRAHRLSTQIETGEWQ
jgi:lysozyme